MLFLNVPYAEKDQAKALGAKWDAGSKKWYVPKGELATPFEQWLVAGAAADRLLEGAAKVGAASKVKPTKKTAPRPAKQAAGRVDSSTGKVVVGKFYREAVGAVGLPWAV